MLIALFAALQYRYTGPAPQFDGYLAPYLYGAKDLLWVPAEPQNVVGGDILWTVSPALPAGLTLNSRTGIISGTPTAAVVSGSYTVTAKNPAGQYQQNITIDVFTETFVEWDTPGVHSWVLPNGVCQAYNRLTLASGGGGGAAANKAAGDSNWYGGGGGGSGRHYTNLDFRPSLGSLAPHLPGESVEIIIGAGGQAGTDDTIGEPGTDGESSSFEIDGFSAFLVAGGGGAPIANYSTLFDNGGLAGGGNNGMAGYSGDAGDDNPDPGGFTKGGSGAYGINTSYGSPALVYWTNAYFSTWVATDSDNAGYGSGGGGGSIAKSLYGIINTPSYNPTFGYGAAGSDGYCKLDWGQIDEFWETF